jgi:predicted amidohydrolase
MHGGTMVRIGIVQLGITANVEQNLEKMLNFLQAAKRSQIEIVCFPEYSLHADIRHPVDLAPAIRRIQAACRQQAIGCIFGAYAHTGGKFKNSVYLINHAGAIHYRYDKVHLWQAESDVFAAGDTTQVIDIGVCRIGIICCWDMAFPVFVAGLAQQGAEIIFCPSYLCDYTNDQQALRAIPLVRAFENCVYFALCDAFTAVTLSESYICHPVKIQQRIAHQQGLLFCDVDLHELSDLRKYYVSLRKRFGEL